MSKEFSIGALRARDNFEMSRSDIVAKMVERMEISIASFRATALPAITCINGPP